MADLTPDEHFAKIEGARVPRGGPSDAPPERAPAGGRAEPVAELGGGDVAAEARDRLYEVIDPELGVDIVNLGLLRSVTIDGERADVRFTVTTPACPLAGYIEDEIRSSLWQLPGVKQLDVTCEYEPAWEPSDMTVVAREQLGWADR